MIANMKNLREYKTGTRFLSAIIAICFIVTNSNIALARPTGGLPKITPVCGPSFDVEKIELPEDAGKVTEAWKGASGKSIIYIQDLHADYTAQKSLANILDYLIEKHNISVILVEGGITDRDFSYIRRTVPRRIREEKAEELLKEGVITGEAYIDIARNYNLKFQGIEDRELYEKNMEAFLDVERFREGAEELAGHLMGISDNLKLHIYDKGLRELDSLRKDFKEEKIAFAEYSKGLKSFIQKLGIGIEGYPNFSLFSAALEMEGRIDFDEVEDERAAYIESLTEAVSKDKIAGLLEKSVDYKNGRITQSEFNEFLLALGAKAEGVDLEEYPNFKLYAGYIEQVRQDGPPNPV